MSRQNENSIYRPFCVVQKISGTFMGILFVFSAAMLTSPRTFSDEVAAATSEDLKMFDQAVQNAEAATSAPVPKKQRISELVNAETRKLKGEDADHKHQMGKWVNDQRKSDDDKNPGASANNGSGSRSSNDFDSDSHATAPGIGKNPSDSGNPHKGHHDSQGAGPASAGHGH